MRRGGQLANRVGARLAGASTVAIALLAALTAVWAHRLADRGRRETTADTELLFFPAPEALRVAALDHHVHLADLLWVRSVLVFGERWEKDLDPAWREWFGRMLLGVVRLDPRWRTPYLYGGVMLRVAGARQFSTRVLELGAAAFPDDPFFPFAVGMNHYLFGDDPHLAYEWVKRAAERPGAPPWYAAAARGFVVERSQRPVAIRFLQEELEQTSDPGLREALEARLRTLVHDELAERLDAAAELYQERRGAPPASVDALQAAGFVESLPEDPFGEGWTIDAGGSIVSAAVARVRAEKALKLERGMLTARR